MVRGRKLLVEGQKENAFRCLRAAFVLDPGVSPNGFALWLYNDLIEESMPVATDPEVLAFVTKEIGHETAAAILKARKRGTDDSGVP
jgi:hypothetical protein